MKAFIKTGKKYLGMIVPALEAAEALIAEGKDEEAMALLAGLPLQSKAMILSMKDFSILHSGKLVLQLAHGKVILLDLV